VFETLDVGLATNLPELPVWVIVDPTRIAQMIGNLLRNAAKFTPAAGRVALCLQVVGACVEIRVSDTGAGIEPELLPELFEPFVQGKQSLARTDGGLGLGLALVKGIIELHHGTVEVKSGEFGKGSNFIVRLPRVIENVVHDEPVPSVQRITPSRHIIVVDDNRDAADSLAQLVKMFGHSTDVAYDGTTAIEKVHANRPDVVLCDLGLPGITGYEVARSLRAHRNDVWLIAVSGYAQLEDIAKARAAGFDDFIAKPPDPETLRALLSYERRRWPRSDMWAG
jgi:CheY-like chemotaxis protein